MNARKSVSGKKARKDSEAICCFGAMDLQEELRSGRYRISKTVDFTLSERGKIRQINAPIIRDRVAQKLLTKHILLPKLKRPLIYDNYASLKGRGTSMARKRMDIHLQRYIRGHGTNGYILQIDIRKYFENIDHEILKRLYRKEVHEPEDVMALIDYIIDTASDSGKGLNLGSECSQIFAVYYLHEIDTWIKIVWGEKYYGRYMDDLYVISESKEHLHELLKSVEEKLADLKLSINRRKTNIVKLTHGFTFLQIKYGFNGNRIVKRLTHDKIVRERKRLKAFRRLVDEGRMTDIKAYNCYMSWRQSALKDSNACQQSIERIDRLFHELFPNCRTSNKITRKDAIRELNNRKDSNLS